MTECNRSGSHTYEFGKADCIICGFEPPEVDPCNLRVVGEDAVQAEHWWRLFVTPPWWEYYQNESPYLLPANWCWVPT